MCICSTRDRNVPEKYIRLVQDNAPGVQNNSVQCGRGEQQLWGGGRTTPRLGLKPIHVPTPRGCVHHHVVSATALSHRTYPPFISAMSSTPGLSPKCVQLVMIWFRSHVAAPHIYSFRSHDIPTDVSLPGWRPVPSALGWPSAMHATAACDLRGVVLLGGCCIS